jgi:carbonic anhydrase
MSFPERLIEGYRAFARGRLAAEQARYGELAESGQVPEVMVIGCCDSRVSPSVIFDTRPGEIFTLRNVANLVPPYRPDEGHHGVSAALEYAVQALKVRHVVVLGHALCGGVRAFADDSAPLSASDFIGKWVELMRPAADAAGPREDYASVTDYLTALEQQSVVHALDNLMTFPYVRIRVERGELALHGAYFGVATGQLSIYDRENGGFVPAVGEHALSEPRF